MLFISGRFKRRLRSFNAIIAHTIGHRVHEHAFAMAAVPVAEIKFFLFGVPGQAMAKPSLIERDRRIILYKGFPQESLSIADNRQSRPASLRLFWK